MSDADSTTHLALPLLLPEQAQKHVTHNEALQRLDILVQAAVLDAGRSAPPEDPLEGQRHLVGPDPTGAWAGQEGALAAYLGGAWHFLSPRPGWQILDLESGQLLCHDGLHWQPPAARPLVGSRLSLGAEADATTRLALAAPASLFSRAGAGHQLKINKSAAAQTASLLFQTGWQGHAEIGLTGDDDLCLKVSADGLSFLEVLRFARGSGLASGAAVAAGPEDARPGRLLTTGAFGLGRADAPGVADWEVGAAHGNGFCTSAPGAAGQLPPEGGAARGGLVLAAGSGAALRSLVVQHIGAEGLAVRGYAGGVPLGGWHRLYSSANLLGPVSTTAGLPTGAVFETGSTATGRFTRHADGRLECHHLLTSSASAATLWSYPAAFTAPPSVSLTPVATALASAQLDAAPEVAALEFSVRNGAGARLAVPCHLIAIGRWA